MPNGDGDSERACPSCGAPAAKAQRFCGACGAGLTSLPPEMAAAVHDQVRQGVTEALAKFVSDQRLAEYSVTDAVLSRLMSVGKIVGLVGAILVAFAGYIGIQSFRDVVRQFEAALKPIQEKAAAEGAALEQQMAQDKTKLASLEQDIAQFSNERTAVGAQFREVQLTLESFKSFQDKAQPVLTESEAVLTSFRKLPAPTGAYPYHLDLGKVLGAAAVQKIRDSGKLVFQVTGATGGMSDPQPQLQVTQALERQFAAGDAKERPSFLYLLGNIVFFNGQEEGYYSQFYEPYKNYAAPIFAIPGNHDGENLPNDISLSAFVANFCAKEATVLPISKDAPRPTMVEPNPYWVLETSYATIVGLYTNVPAGGAIDDRQQAWLETELAKAPLDRAVIVAMNHPVFSFDNAGMGSARMATALQNAVNKARRVPNLVLASYTHNYQRMEYAGLKPSLAPFVIVGVGGYKNLHKIERKGATDAPNQGADEPVRLRAAFDKYHGFVRLAVTPQAIEGTFVAAGRGDDDPDRELDKFSYSAKPILLGDGESVRFVEQVPATPAAANEDAAK